MKKVITIIVIALMIGLLYYVMLSAPNFIITSGVKHLVFQ